MTRLSVGFSNFYRSEKRYSDGPSQSGRPPTVYRVLPCLLSGQGQPPRLRPAWLPVAGGVGPWSGGAAGPPADRAAAVSGCRLSGRGRTGRSGRRKARAGRRVQQRRHRADRDAVRRHCAAPVPTDGAALVEPPRLTLRQTRRAAAPAAVTAPMRLGHLNIRSATAHLDQLAQLLMTYRLDIICLTETFLNSDVDDRTLIVPGYQILRRDRPGGGSGGGVAILLRSELLTKELQTPAAGSALETLWLQVGDHAKIIVGVGYRPPSSRMTPALDDLQRQLADVLANDLPTYLLGDFNIDTLRPAKPGVVSYLQLLQELSLHQLVTSPTRQSENPTLIDHIVTNRPQTATETRVTPCDISDHDLISTTISTTVSTTVREPRQRVTVTVRSTRRVNTNAMCLDLLLADWSGVTDCDNITDMWTAFLATWHPIIDHHMPMRTLQLRHQAYPWLRDEEVQAAMAARRRARRARDRAPSESTQQQLRTCRNAVKTTLNRACAAFFEHSYKNSRPKTWKNVRQFLVASGKARPRTTSPAATDERWAQRSTSPR